MARSRNIKPSFFTNDLLGECKPLARLLFAGLWTVADREGRLADRPKKIKAELLPYDNCDCEKLLNELQKYGFIIRYKAEQSQYIQIHNFVKHQNPHVKEGASTIPAPDRYQTSTVQNVPLTDSVNLIPLTPILIPDSLKGASATVLPDWIPKTDWQDFLEMRKKKERGASLTDRQKTLAISNLDSLRKAGQDPGAVIQQSIVNGWKTFYAMKENYENTGRNTGINGSNSQSQGGTEKVRGRGQTKADYLDQQMHRVLAKFGVEAETTDIDGTQAESLALRSDAAPMLLDNGTIRKG